MADRGSASTDSGPGNGARDRPPCVLSIAGSDSGGGAGIQADLKAFAACGVHGMTAITALTAQNTVGVSAVEPVSPEMIVAQVAAVADDIGVDAVKIGMLGTVGTIEAVAAALDLLRGGTPVVLDPVMVSESGAELLEVSARGALMELLLPRVTVVTPNLPEARALMAAASAPAPPGAPAPAVAPAPAAAAAPDAEDVGALARALRELGPQVVVVTGGHREQAIDVFFDGAAIVELPGERYPSGAAHGSGCTHSSVLAARLAWGDSPLEAARVAKRMASEAVRDGLRGVGAGAGPVNILGVT
ncbi:MAG: bifunctional hydroxymethylpyrimidine kinase/phosphomethylpyrimidine kinase [Solirubrobacteraceae bacterium]